MFSIWKRTASAVLFLFFSFAAHSAESSSSCTIRLSEEVQRLDLGRDDQWLRLLHYRRNFPFYGSQADGQSFFIAPDGGKDPASELSSLVKALCSGEVRATGNPNIKALPARCQFPARERFLRDRVSSRTEWPTPTCPDLEKWRQRMHAASATLIFSSYYPNNPSSVYGHTLLRLNKKPEGAVVSPSALLSHGVNFAATTDTNNPVLYAFYGLIGRFHGEFTALPYFYKVREYADFESRDIWEYDLNLSKKEVENLVDHLWELAFTYFDYYYLTENCSYHLLTALEGAVPRINPSEKLPRWIIPADTVKAVVRTPGLVSRVEFRPSLYRQFIARYDRIEGDPGMRDAFDQIAFSQTGDTLKTRSHLSKEQMANVMDAALDFWDFKYARETSDESSPESKYKEKLLGFRSQLPTTAKLEFPGKDALRPDLGHESFRFEIGAGQSQIYGGFYDLGARFALHGFLENPQGYPDTASIDFLKFKWRHEPSNHKTKLQDFRLFDLTLLAPVTHFHYPVSWRVALGAENLQGFGCDGCLSASFLVQGGYTVALAERHLLYGLFGLRALYSSEIQPRSGVLAGQTNLGWRWRFSPSWSALLEGQVHQILASERDWQFSGSLQSLYEFRSNMAVAFNYKRLTDQEHETALSLYLYY